MKEHYVTHEQAQALKRLGFDKKVLAVWHFDGEGWNLIPDYGATFQHPKDILHWNTSHAWGAHIYSAPRLDQAQAWLWEKYKLWIEVTIKAKNDFTLCIVDEYGEVKFIGDGKDSIPNTYIAGIDKVLELLTNKS